MILKISVCTLWLVKMILWWLYVCKRLPKSQWKRLYIVLEEYITNFIKYGKIDKTDKCWLRMQRYGDKILVCLMDNSKAFDPFVANTNALGIRLMTGLLESKYRRQRGMNVFLLNVPVK